MLISDPKETSRRSHHDHCSHSIEDSLTHTIPPTFAEMYHLPTFAPVENYATVSEIYI